MSKLISAIKAKIPIYKRVNRLKRDLLEWKKGLYKPGHFYSPIVSSEDIPASINVDYSGELEGINLNDEGQLKLLSILRESYRENLFPDKKHPEFRYYADNDYFSFSDGIFLNLMMRHYRPSRIIEVGSGFSSAVMLDTNEKFLGNKTLLTFIEPYPEERLNNLLNAGDSATIICDFVQNVDLSVFSELVAGDILFIDSSHVSKYNSDVNYILFRILPRLRPGVIVHFHDIFFPFEYPLEWLRQGRSWNEAYLLKAFLLYNSQFDVALFTSYLEGRYVDWFKINMVQCLRNHEVITLDGDKKTMNTSGQSIYLVKK